MNAPTAQDEAELVQLVQNSLSDELLKPQERRLRAAATFVTATTGHCFTATEALYWLLGGPGSGWRGRVMRVDADGQRRTHWFLHHDCGRVIDATADQFLETPDYTRGKGCGFSTRKMGKPAVGPSYRAQVVLDRVHAQRAARAA